MESKTLTNNDEDNFNVGAVTLRTGELEVRRDLDWSYLIPRELCRELPKEEVVLVQAETFVDQSKLRGDAGKN